MMRILIVVLPAAFGPTRAEDLAECTACLRNRRRQLAAAAREGARLDR